MATDLQARLREAIKFLGWVSASYEAHAKCTDVPDEVDAYIGSAEMARNHAAALSTVSADALDALSARNRELEEALRELVNHYGDNEHKGCDCPSCKRIRRARSALERNAADALSDDEPSLRDIIRAQSKALRLPNRRNAG